MFDYEEHKQPSEKTPIIQAKRKVVYKEDSSIENAILWDKHRKGYYKNMRPRPNSSKYIYGRRIGNISGGMDEASKHFDYMKQMYVDDSEKDRIGLNEVLFEFDENHFVEANKKNMQVYDGGEKIPEQEEPFAIRLYAEGNMDHARGLSIGMKDYLAQAAEDSILPIGRMRNRRVLIKATEFRSLNEVAEAYGSSPEGETAFYKESLRTHLAQSKNLEGSFGGHTGDMTRPVTQETPRSYDLIQTTFFWLQGYRQDELNAEVDSINESISQWNAQIRILQKGIDKLPKQEKTQRTAKISELSEQITAAKINRQSIYVEYYQAGNEASYEMMICFVRNQLKKLKPNGEIRIVVSNINPYAEIRGRLTAESIAGDESDNPLYQNIQIEVRVLQKPRPQSDSQPDLQPEPQTYPQQLEDEGLNSVGFQQRQTRKQKTVTGSRSENPITNDLIIIIRRGDSNV